MKSLQLLTGVGDVLRLRLTGGSRARILAIEGSCTGMTIGDQVTITVARASAGTTLWVAASNPIAATNSNIHAGIGVENTASMQFNVAVATGNVTYVTELETMIAIPDMWLDMDCDVTTNTTAGGTAAISMTYELDDDPRP